MRRRNAAKMRRCPPPWGMGPVSHCWATSGTPITWN